MSQRWRGRFGKRVTTGDLWWRPGRARGVQEEESADRREARGGLSYRGPLSLAEYARASPEGKAECRRLRDAVLTGRMTRKQARATAERRAWKRASKAKR